MSAAQGLAEKQLGLDLVELHNADFVATMREHARAICRSRGHVTTDDLREIAIRSGQQPRHQNAWGSILRRPDFVPGGYEPSRLASNHGRVIRRWRLADKKP